MSEDEHLVVLSTLFLLCPDVPPSLPFSFQYLGVLGRCGMLVNEEDSVVNGKLVWQGAEETGDNTPFHITVDVAIETEKSQGKKLEAREFSCLNSVLKNCTQILHVRKMF